MKQGKPVITVAIAAIAVALVIYFGFYVAKVFSEPYTTALAYTYTSNDSAEAVGILVRQETVLPTQTGIVDVTSQRGRRWAWARAWPRSIGTARPRTTRPT